MSKSSKTEVYIHVRGLQNIRKSVSVTLNPCVQCFECSKFLPRSSASSLFLTNATPFWFLNTFWIFFPQFAFWFRAPSIFSLLSGENCLKCKLVGVFLKDSKFWLLFRDPGVYYRRIDFGCEVMDLYWVSVSGCALVQYLVSVLLFEVHSPQLKCIGYPDFQIIITVTLPYQI